MENQTVSPMGSPTIDDYSSSSSSESESPEFGFAPCCVPDDIAGSLREGTEKVRGEVAKEGWVAFDPQACIEKLEGRVSRLLNVMDVRCEEDALRSIAVGDLDAGHSDFTPFWRAAALELLYSYGVDGFGHLANWMEEREITELSEEKIREYGAMVKIRQAIDFLENDQQCPHPRNALRNQTKLTSNFIASAHCVTNPVRFLMENCTETLWSLRSLTLELINYDKISLLAMGLYLEIAKSEEDTVTVFDLVRFSPCARNTIAKHFASHHNAAMERLMRDLLPPPGMGRPMGMGRESEVPSREDFLKCLISVQGRPSIAVVHLGRDSHSGTSSRESDDKGSDDSGDECVLS